MSGFVKGLVKEVAKDTATVVKEVAKDTATVVAEDAALSILHRNQQGSKQPLQPQSQQLQEVASYATYRGCTCNCPVSTSLVNEDKTVSTEGCSCTCPVDTNQYGGKVNTLTVKQLKEVATILNIKGRSNLKTKEQLSRAILNEIGA